jgi:hypothetical protein
MNKLKFYCLTSADQAAISEMKLDYKAFMNFSVAGCPVLRKQTNKVIGIIMWDLSKGKTVFNFSGQKQVGPKTILIG